MHVRTSTLGRMAAIPFLTACLAATIAFAALWAPSANAQQPEPTADIVDTAIDAGSFTTLVDLVVAADLTDALRGDGPLTVFAPTDDAFAAVPQDVLDALAADPALLTQVLLYHVVAGDVRAADVVTLTSAETLQGESIAIDASDGVVLDGAANVVQTDVLATNGVIHVIDAVLVPDSVANALAAGAVTASPNGGAYVTGINAVVVDGDGPLAAGAGALAIEQASGLSVEAIWSLEGGEWLLYAPGPIDFGLTSIVTPAALFVVLG